jgi:hypothetical protein
MVILVSIDYQNQDRTYTPVYINGFYRKLTQPFLITLAVGIKGKVGDWNIFKWPMVKCF